MSKLELDTWKQVADRVAGGGLPVLWLVIAFIAAAAFFWLRFP